MGANDGGRAAFMAGQYLSVPALARASGRDPREGCQPAIFALSPAGNRVVSFGRETPGYTCAHSGPAGGPRPGPGAARNAGAAYFAATPRAAVSETPGPP